METRELKPESIIRIMVRGVYDQQKLRIQMGNRIVANFKAKLGQKPGMTEKKLDKVAKTLLDQLRDSYTKLTDGVVALPKKNKFEGDELISEYAELVLVRQYLQMVKNEEENFNQFKYELENHPIYTEWLQDIAGIGPALAGVIISEIDIHKATYPSSLWKYAGLDVTDVYLDADGNRYHSDLVSTTGDGTKFATCRKVGPNQGQLVPVNLTTEGRSRKSEHLIQKEYTAKDGTIETRNSITFSPFLKTKLIGVAGTSFLRQVKVFVNDERMSTPDRLKLAKSLNWPVPEQLEGEEDDLYKMRLRDTVIDFLRVKGYKVVVEKCPYAMIYDNIKARYANDPRHKDKTKGHRHNMAVRYMVKRFLVDLYSKWRALEGLPVAEEYSVAKLGLVHGEVSSGKEKK